MEPSSELNPTPMNLANSSYRIRSILLQVELEFFDPNSGKVTGTTLVPKTESGDPSALIVYEAEFPTGLLDFLKSKGLNPVS